MWHTQRFHPSPQPTLPFLGNNDVSKNGGLLVSFLLLTEELYIPFRSYYILA